MAIFGVLEGEEEDDGRGEKKNVTDIASHRRQVKASRTNY